MRLLRKQIFKLKENDFFLFLNKRIFRFIGIGIIGEILYLILYAIFNSLGMKSSFSVIPAGLSCIFFNSYMHCRYSFKSNYSFNFLIQYILIQIICMFITYLISFFLVSINMNTLAMGLTTLVIWGLLSFILMNTLIDLSKKNN